MKFPEKYNPQEAERKWQKFWEKSKIYKFDPDSKKEIYSIDTPPPTVSGKMHIGHAFSYSQQDFIARFHRMKQENVFYPFGTDDNGLPTERLVEKLKNVKSTKMSRQEFVALCQKTITEIKEDFINDWKFIGMSCDFSTTYSTIDKHCIKTSQKSFLDLFKEKLVYQHEAPSMWCVQCQTAIAQADLEDKELDSSFIDVHFELEDKTKITIATTRPELLAACVCIYVHPNDKRYKNLAGKKATVPLFNQKVRIYADESADQDKGTGVLMICSYGDKYDVEAVNKRKLEPRIIFTRDGKLNELAKKYQGLAIKEARKEIINDLEKEKLLVNKKLIKHIVNVHERCGTEIEFLSTKQWFIKILDNKKKFIDAGNKIKWYPEYMKKRYMHWVEGLNWDWCISRQRHFGVPFPVWYCKKCNSILIAEEKDLPVDPLTNKPKNKCKCGSDNFEGEKDVMDTWATSSVTPEIILNWVNDPGYNLDFKKMHPLSLRPQAHDIIRTWAFYTIVKSIYHHNEIPWKNIIISGHVLDPKGEAMHKSKGNAVEPAGVLEKYGADAMRFWAAGSKLGEDLRYLEKDLVTGQKTITKLWNASKFCSMHLENYDYSKPKKLEIFDEWLLRKLNKIIKECTEAFENYEYAAPKSLVENFFWNTFCDYYLEIVKFRLYNSQGDPKKSAQYVLYSSLLSILKLFASITPHVTEEIYQTMFREKEKSISIHISSWPLIIEANPDIEKAGDKGILIISEVRKFKAENKMSLKDPIKLKLDKSDKKQIDLILNDLKTVCNIKEIEFSNNLPAVIDKNALKIKVEKI